MRTPTRALLLTTAATAVLAGCSPSSPTTPPPTTAATTAAAPTTVQRAATPVSPRQAAENVYVGVLDDKGIHYSSRSAAITAGYAVCDFLASGGTQLQAAGIAVQSGGYSNYEGGYIVGDAQGSLCKLPR